MMKATEAYSHRYGPWALIAGGSEGIGYCFADRLAEAGINLILIARRIEPLAEARDTLLTKHPDVEIHEPDGTQLLVRVCHSNCKHQEGNAGAWQ